MIGFLKSCQDCAGFEVQTAALVGSSWVEVDRMFLLFFMIVSHQFGWVGWFSIKIVCSCHFADKWPPSFFSHQSSWNKLLSCPAFQLYNMDNLNFGQFIILQFSSSLFILLRSLLLLTHLCLWKGSENNEENMFKIYKIQNINSFYITKNTRHAYHYLFK